MLNQNFIFWMAGLETETPINRNWFESRTQPHIGLFMDSSRIFSSTSAPSQPFNLIIPNTFLLGKKVSELALIRWTTFCPIYVRFFAYEGIAFGQPGKNIA
jgi:hypothetical protein